jgi:hypothetical protein
MIGDESDQERGFTVVDKRGASSETQAASDTETQAASDTETQAASDTETQAASDTGSQAASDTATQAASDTATAAAGTGAATGTPPRVDFSGFCLSLGTSALYHLGVVGDPETGKPVEEKNLPLAQQTIDALEMLQTKTEGNLDAEEKQLLEGLLYELRVRFVEAGKASAE